MVLPRSWDTAALGVLVAGLEAAGLERAFGAPSSSEAGLERARGECMDFDWGEEGWEKLLAEENLACAGSI